MCSSMSIKKERRAPSVPALNFAMQNPLVVAATEETEQQQKEIDKVQIQVERPHDSEFTCR